jgi:hypothetical protein
VTVHRDLAPPQRPAGPVSEPATPPRKPARQDSSRRRCPAPRSPCSPSMRPPEACFTARPRGGFRSYCGEGPAEHCPAHDRRRLGLEPEQGAPPCARVAFDVSFHAAVMFFVPHRAWMSRARRAPPRS